MGSLTDRDTAAHCASEHLHRKRRQKRWMPEDEYQDGLRNVNMDVPYNDDMAVVVERSGGSAGGDLSRPEDNNVFNRLAGGNVIISRTARPSSNILYNEHQPGAASTTTTTTNAGAGGEPGTIRTSNRNIIGNIFDRKRTPLNATTYGSRPVHKNHVEIITKRPTNIIVNNYNPDVVISHPVNPAAPSINIKHQNINLSVRNELLERSRTVSEKKSTCMLYLQADHTFFQKLGSDDSSIEAITRHVQRANAIYKNTGGLRVRPGNECEREGSVYKYFALMPPFRPSQ